MVSARTQQRRMKGEIRVAKVSRRRLLFSMASGPVLIFDKSTLQSLNADEAMWLDNFFSTNITPPFFIETLADLEKQVQKGRTPEQVVGNLAYKTPDRHSHPNVHHMDLLETELFGWDKIAMDGRCNIAGGRPVKLKDSAGIMIRETREEEALHRWQRHEFLEIERGIAKKWRRALSDVNYDEAYKFFQKWFPEGKRPRALQDIRGLLTENIDRRDQGASLEFGMTLLGFPPHARERIFARWREAGRPAVGEFAPYFRHVFSVELFFYLAIAADLISRGRASNKVDLAYLYYLPFCNVFTSGDDLHARVAPLFLRQDQSFVSGIELKADLERVDQHFSSLPEEVKKTGVIRFAGDPPTGSSFKVTQFWNKYVPRWRERQAESRVPLPEPLQRALRQLVERIENEALPVDPATPITFATADYVHMQRRVLTGKGKWRLFPPEVIKKAG